MHDERIPTSAIIFRIAVCVALVGAGFGVVAALVATKPDAGRTSEAAPPQRLSVLEVKPFDIARFVSAYGTARALESADVPARVAAVVESLGANYATGSRVERGDVLAMLDASDFIHQVSMAEEAIRAIDAQVAMLDAQEKAVREAARLAQSEREIAATDLARVEKAAADGAAQPREIDRARQGLIAATRASVLAEDALAQVPPRRQSLAAQRAGEQARLELARLSAERCRITAPISGVLQLADLERGESVAPGAMIARIVDPSAVEVPLRIPASARALAPVGASAALSVRGGTAKTGGTVSRVAPEDDPASRTATVFVELRQQPLASGDVPANVIAPGAFVEARITPGSLTAGGNAPRIAVPRRALRDGQIAIVEGGRIRMRRVSVDFNISETPAGAPVGDTDWAVLDDDLPVGTLVVIDGSRSIVEGQLVEPVIAVAGKGIG